MTAGANQALVSLMLTLLDPSDRAVLFRPYYFNTLMAIQVAVHFRCRSACLPAPYHSLQPLPVTIGDTFLEIEIMQSFQS